MIYYISILCFCRYVKTLKGRNRFLAKIKLGNSKERSKAQGQAVNSICQGSAGDIIKIAIINIHALIVGEVDDSDPATVAAKFHMLRGHCRILLQVTFWALQVIYFTAVPESHPSVIKEAGWLLQMSMERAASLLGMSSEIDLCISCCLSLFRVHFPLRLFGIFWMLGNANMLYHFCASVKMKVGRTWGSLEPFQINILVDMYIIFRRGFGLPSYNRLLFQTENKYNPCMFMEMLFEDDRVSNKLYVVHDLKSYARFGKDAQEPDEIITDTEQDDLFVELFNILVGCPYIRARSVSKNQRLKESLLFTVQTSLPEKKNLSLSPMDWVKFLVSAIIGLVTVVGSLNKSKPNIKVLAPILSAVIGFCAKAYLSLIVKEVIILYFILMEQSKATRQVTSSHYTKYFMVEFIETYFTVAFKPVIRLTHSWRQQMRVLTESEEISASPGEVSTEPEEVPTEPRRFPLSLGRSLPSLGRLPPSFTELREVATELGKVATELGEEAVELGKVATELREVAAELYRA
ncbi:hypothetical protein RHSIM_Rhsim01G0105100 [Rhododendron simsii]|uniref:DNA-directed DNA polymerase family A palm domain-containing protein n=1 Tax=Rhododendron simsii TaxID=118357 RepID=A0A834HF74_RHOSS|nr:hypothetical protein RHSIM_Rhsim01G0105100 [Rhododendron simsii]